MTVPTEQIQRVLELQRRHRWTMARTTAAERIRRLRRLRDVIWGRRAELHRALRDDFRKNATEADITELYPFVAEVDHAIRHLPRWMKPQRVKTPRMLAGTHSRILHEAKGLVLILSPWNYPLNLLLNPLVAAIAAGNCAVIKPSSKVPHTAALSRELLAEVFPEQEVAVFEGSSAVADALLAEPFDHVFFTGSTRVGRKVMRAAAEHLTPVTLELGGKSPVIVDRSADLDRTAERVLWGKFVNAGQTCVAPDYVLIHESIAERFVARARRVLEDRFGRDAAARRESPSYCRLVSQRHAAGLQDLLQRAVDHGARVEFGGTIDPEARYLEPTLLGGVTEDSPVMEDEIFGPILPILTYRSLDEAIRIVRARPKPLALYVFAGDDAVVDRVLAETTAGGSCVNSVILHLANPDLPFGGVGTSGMGRYHGFRGFQELSNERAVLRQGWLDTLRFFYPPYTDRVDKTIRLAMRYMS